MHTASLPHALTTLVARGILPHATLILGGDETTHDATVKQLQHELQVAPSDTIDVVEPPAITELRRILDRISLRPFGSTQTLAVFRQFDRWTEACATTILKTLEEPPSHARLVLLAQSDTSILPTIRSRVARFRYPVTPTSTRTSASVEPSKTLREQFEWSAEVAKSGEAVTDALSTLFLQATDPQQQRKLLEQLTDVGSHPVNKRLALDAAILKQKAR